MDYYEILGVPKTATQDEIKSAWRRLAAKAHPDKGGDTAKFQTIEEAYRILSNPETKAAYDNPVNNFNFRNNSPFNGMFGAGMNEEDFIARFFNNNIHSHNRNQKQVFRTTTNISLNDVYYGTTQIFKIQTPKGEKLVNVEVPKGIPDKFQLRFENILENASLLVEFRVLPDLKFERRGNDLYCNQQVSVLDLIIGKTITFVTLSGKELEVKIPPKTQPFMQLKLAGQGLPIMNSNYYGDQILLIKPFLPDTIHEDIINSISKHQ